jgi:hypothetical protein
MCAACPSLSLWFLVHNVFLHGEKETKVGLKKSLIGGVDEGEGWLLSPSSMVPGVCQGERV